MNRLIQHIFIVSLKEREEVRFSLCGHAPLALWMVMQGVSANFAPHFAPSPAPVAQGIEQRFPKPQVACSIHAGSAQGYAPKSGVLCT